MEELFAKVPAGSVVAAADVTAAGAVAGDAEVGALGLTTSSPAAKPKFLTGVEEVRGLIGADLVSATYFVSATDSGTVGEDGFAAVAAGAVNAGATVLDPTVLELVLTAEPPTTPTTGKLVTILTAISLLIVFGLLSRIRGNPTTAISTKTAAPIKRWRAR